MKESLDSGLAGSVEEAVSLFHGYSVVLKLDVEQLNDASAQITLLTAVALARRVFLGGVYVVGAADVPVLVPLPVARTLNDAVRELGGITMPELDSAKPIISIGGPAQRRSHEFHVRTACAGWRGGIMPIEREARMPMSLAMPLAAMLAAALAINEVFLYLRKETATAGRRSLGLSLWKPQPTSDWLDDDTDGPRLRYLPSRLWLIGLGHLGQAYLWGLGLLPYVNPAELQLVLQDVDEITASTESTSILSDASMVGRKKTREMAHWAERRGFSPSIQERLFDASFKRQDTEPAVALCGLDNALGRRALDQVGFDVVIEAGLGRGYQDFRTMRVHTLPSRRSAAELWRDAAHEEDVSDRPAYVKLREEGVLDQCGTTLLAGKAVGAPFVGAVAACLVLAEVLRLLHGAEINQVIDIDLQDLAHRIVIPQTRDLRSVNPGYTLGQAFES